MCIYKYIFIYIYVCACSIAQSCLTLCNPMNCIAHQAPLPMKFSGQEYWSGVFFKFRKVSTSISSKKFFRVPFPFLYSKIPTINILGCLKLPPHITNLLFAFSLGVSFWIISIAISSRSLIFYLQHLLYF